MAEEKACPIEEDCVCVGQSCGHYESATGECLIENRSLLLPRKAISDLIAQRDKLMDSLRKMTAEAKLSLEESGGCDHSVGICTCGLEHDVTEAEILLGILKECPDCSQLNPGCSTCRGTGFISPEPAVEKVTHNA